MFNEDITIKANNVISYNHVDGDKYATVTGVVDYFDLKNIQNKGILPERYIINHNATILFWNDGTKTIVKKAKDDDYNKKLGFLWAYFQKMSGLSKTKANEYLENLSDDSEKNLKFDCNMSDIHSFDHTVRLAFENIKKTLKSMETKK